MVPKPIFVATHPRACSTAFERVFMTQRDTLKCIHEPFGDAFYFGPERLSQRYAGDEEGREKSGFANTTYRDVVQGITEAGKEGKRVFIKDIVHYLFPPDGKPATVAASLGPQEPGNPTVVPLGFYRNFVFTFLIRHPRRSIPSYYRCTVPPLSQITGFDYFMPSEAGYDELRRLFDFLVQSGIVDRENVVVVDADDMLDNPEGIIRAYCDKVDVTFDPSMLEWTEEDTKEAAAAFKKWDGFHDDAICSSSLKPRSHKQVCPPICYVVPASTCIPSEEKAKVMEKLATTESDDAEWTKKFGEKGQKIIRATVEENIPDYEYLKAFALRA